MAHSQAPAGFAVLDPSQYASHLRDDLGWATANVPFIDVQNPDILTAYYYRWRSYKKHIQQDPKTGRYVVTEFLPKVGWAGKDNTIPAASGHHIMEGRWIHNETYLNDYIRFWYEDGGNPFSYTNWIGWAAWQRYKLNGNQSFIAKLLPDLVNAYKTYPTKYSAFAGDKPCWFQTAGSDAMEVAISGDGCRPTIASAIWGEATAVSLMANETNQTAPDEAAFSQKIVLDLHWNPNISSFAVIPGVKRAPMPPPAPTPAPPVPAGFAVFDQNQFCCDQALCKDGHSKFLFQGPATVQECTQKCIKDEKCKFVTLSHQASPWCMNAEYCNSTNPFGGAPATTYKREKSEPVEATATNATCDLSTVRVPNKPVDVRELLAFMPWYFSDAPSDQQLIPPGGYTKYTGMFKELTDPQGYQAKWGLTSAEQRSPCFNYSWQHGDCWNQNSWPYETARILTSVANVINDYPEGEKEVSTSVYLSLLEQYARQHTQSYADNDTASPPGSGHVFENIHPFLGYWNNRARMYWSNSKMKDMGDDYNHSTFNDLVLSGLLGLRAQRANSIVINPLLDWKATKYFAVDHVKYKGKYISVFYDADGSRYNKGAGLTVIVDGKVAAHAATVPLPKPLEVQL